MAAKFPRFGRASAQRPLLGFILACLLLPWSVAAAELSITIIRDPQSTLQQRMIDTLTHALGNAPGIHLQVLNADAKPSGTAHNGVDLYLCLGTKATAQGILLSQETPILSVFVPKLAFRSFETLEGAISGRARQVSAIYIDQPFSRQIALAEALDDRRQRIGALLSADMPSEESAFRAAAEHAHVPYSVLTVKGEDELFSKLNALLDDIDVLITVPDLRIYNRRTIKAILLSAYRRHVPLIGFSEAYVKAGAIAAVYSTPEQIARQAAEIILGLSKRRPLILPPPSYPKYFSVATNRQVARSLDFRLPSDAALMRRLGNGGDRP